MYETEDDLGWLQALLDQSHPRMGPHMRSILTPERTLTARQIVTHLRGIKYVALATVTAAGAPSAAPAAISVLPTPATGSDLTRAPRGPARATRS